MTPDLKDDFKELINLLGVYSETANRLSKLQTSIDGEFIELVDEYKTEYIKLQNALAGATRVIETIATRNMDDWFGKKKSLVTPYGTVSFRKTTKLDVPNEELTIHIIEHDSALNADEFIMEQKTLRKEALETLDDATLSRLRVKRIEAQSFTVKEASVDLGKAVAEMEKKEAA